MKFLIIFLILFSFQVFGRNAGQTEITTEEGIEVFKQEKYYLLKKNVRIVSDEFELSADLVKAYFENDMYNVVRIDSKGEVTLKSTKNINASGEEIDFNIKNEDLFISGKNSLLIIDKIQMASDETIKINNLKGNFIISGLNSRLKSNDVNISGSLIKGTFIKIDEGNEVRDLYVEDKTQIYIKTKTLSMYAIKANYDKKNNIIELFEDVKIIRNNDVIIGHYAKINTLNDSYKVISKKSEKVKILLNKIDE